MEKYHNKISEVRNGILIFFSALVPVLLMTAIIQIMIDQDKLLSNISMTFSTANTYDYSTLLYYLTISFIHLFLCTVTIYYFKKKTELNISKSIVKRISKYRILCLIIIVSMFFILDHINPVISILSHDRLYFVLKKSHFFTKYFKSFPHDFLNINLNLFYCYSIFPFLLIFFALIVLVVSSFSIGKDLARFQKLSYEKSSIKLIDEETDKIMSNIKNYIFGLSIILTTSTIATILFFQIPIHIFENQTLKNQFQQISYAIGFCWGVIFSLTMLAMSVLPITIVYKRLNKIKKTGRYKIDNRFKDWVVTNQNKLSLLNNLRTIFSIFSPIILSIMTQFISKNF